MLVVRWLFFLVLFLASPGNARWMRHDEASGRVIKIEKKVTVKKDFSSVEDIIFHYKILSEKARQKLAIMDFEFNGANTQLEIFEAYGITKGKKTYTPKEEFEVKDVSSGADGFDSRRSIRVPVRNLEVGSEVVVRYRYRQKSNLQGYYNYFVYPSYHDFVVEKANYEIQSETPLRFTKDDPRNFLKVESSNDGRKIQISLKRPFLDYYVDERDSINITSPATLVSITNMKSWAELGGLYLKEIQKQIQVDFDTTPLRKSVKSGTKTLDKIDAVFAELMERVNYIGDWRTVAGHYTPRMPDVIWKTKYGDCKDFSLLAYRTLRDLGIKAGFALIDRGVSIPKYPKPDQIQLGYFDHMIVWYEDPSTREVHFIDPTNKITLNSYIRKDLADRPVLILEEGGKSRLSRTPALSPTEGTIKIKTHTKVNFGKTEDTTFEVTVAGRFMADYMYEQLTNLAATFENNFSEWFFERTNLQSFKLKSRPKFQQIVSQPLVYKGEVEKVHFPYQTSLGEAHFASANILAFPEVQDLIDRVSDYDLGVPQTWEHTDTTEGLSMRGELPPACDVDNEYFKLHSSFSRDGKFIRRHVTSSYKRSWIPRAVTATKSFRTDVERVKMCRRSFGMVR